MSVSLPVLTPSPEPASASVLSEQEQELMLSSACPVSFPGKCVGDRTREEPWLQAAIQLPPCLTPQCEARAPSCPDSAGRGRTMASS